MPAPSFPDVSPATRKVMQGNKGKDTKPEMIVRRLVHAMGYRYRLHRSDLPGKPDLVFGPRRKVIFVHGCFWHRHDGGPRAAVPTMRRDYWTDKFARNVARDARNAADLNALGWRTLTIWECEAIKEPASLASRVRSFLA